MTFYSRHAWGARDREPGPGFLVPSRVKGIALHWPAMGGRLDAVPEVAAALRGWQDYHMDTKGWSDIAYQRAVDQMGNTYGLRGIRRQSGANGDEDVNQAFGALLLVVGPGEKPTDAMIRAVRRTVAVFRDHFPRATQIVGHGDIRPEPTECPGPLVRALIKSNGFQPGKPKR